MSGKIRRATFFFAIAALGASLSNLGAESADPWVLAASPFEATKVGTFYASYAQAVPTMVLQRLGTGFVRLTPPGEYEARALSSYREGLSALLKSRAELIFAMDKTLLEPVGPLLRSKHEKTARDKVVAKEKEISKYQKSFPGSTTAIANRADNSGERQIVTLWENGEKLFEPATGSIDFATLRKAGIQGLVSGTLEDEAGYLVITLRVETGVPGVEPLETLAAGPYEELDFLIDSLASSVKTSLSYVAPVTLGFDVEPKESTLFVDGLRVQPESGKLVLPEGNHRVEVSSPGFESASIEQEFVGNENYLVEITLEPEALVPVSFSSTIADTLLYIDTLYVGSTPVRFEMPPGTALGMAVKDEVPTWFYFTAGVNEPDRIVRNNAVKTKTRIERQRSILYWSLGSLYISLPVSMLTYGVLQDRLRAFDSGKLPETDATINEINGWGLASNVATGISVGLGVNYAIQLVRYLLAAEQALPREAGYTDTKGNR